MVIKLAWRSLWRNKRRTLITACSISFGLALAIFFIAMGEGAYARLIDMVVRMQAGHVTLEDPLYRDAPAVDLWITVTPGERRTMEGWPEVECTKALILGQGVAKSGAGSAGAVIMGVEPSVEARTSPLARNMVSGTYLEDQDEALVVVGGSLADHLNLKVGKKLVLATNDVSGNLVEELCRVKGIFHTGSEEMDASFIQAPLSFASRLFDMPQGGVTQLGLVLKDARDQTRVIRRLEKLLGPQGPAVLPWQAVMPEVASYIRMDKGSNWIFQGILLFIVLFTIFNTLLMSVLERQREFAVLLAIGTHPGSLRRQILGESALLGLLGCASGCFLGWALSGLMNLAKIDLSSLISEGVTISGFAVSMELYAKVTWEVMLFPAAVVFASVLVLSLIPMHRAGRVAIVEQLR